ncbi:MAG: ArsA family ATPase [Deltaproteobacteria bacterium]|nr:ArsA family ATPase [Deltaproteobacteria bacterium]
MKIGDLVRTKTVIVCCGAGGVGKTTTSAALALGAAEIGRRALVLTIDPARRLAQALGIPPTGPEPVQITAPILDAAGVALPPGGELHAWMLDPRVVLESVVDRFAPSREAAARIRRTRLYGALAEVMAGLQEYTAAEALFEFTERGRYDLIVLDTPPSRNALDFLDAPRRLARFLDERTLAVFAPAAEGANALVRAAAKIVTTALSKTFGEAFTLELQEFLGAFGTLFGKMRLHADGVRDLLRSDRAAFLVITSPEELALEEALFFKRRIKELGLLAEGFVLNRSYATDRALETPHAITERLPPDAPNELIEALKKLVPLAEHEALRAKEHRSILERLAATGREDRGQGAIALPYLEQATDDIPALMLLSRVIRAAT